MNYEPENLVTLPPGLHPGLQDVIAAAGHAIENNNGSWYASDAVAAQTIIDAFTDEQALAHAKAAKSLEVSMYAKRLRDTVVATISAGEMASWPIKRAEAAQFSITGNAADCPMLSAEAAARGITLADLAVKVGGNSLNFAGLECAIGGADGKHRDAIKALTTVEAVLTYDYGAGWPAI